MDLVVVSHRPAHDVGYTDSQRQPARRPSVGITMSSQSTERRGEDMWVIRPLFGGRWVVAVGRWVVVPSGPEMDVLMSWSPVWFVLFHLMIGH